MSSSCISFTSDSIRTFLELLKLLASTLARGWFSSAMITISSLCDEREDTIAAFLLLYPPITVGKYSSEGETAKTSTKPFLVMTSFQRFLGG